MFLANEIKTFNLIIAIHFQLSKLKRENKMESNLQITNGRGGVNLIAGVRKKREVLTTEA